MPARRDDLFERHDITWQRIWHEDAGAYIWRANDRRLEAWRCGWQRTEHVGKDGEVHEGLAEDYRVTLDGALVGQTHKLRDAMDKGAIAWMQRRAAA